MTNAILIHGTCDEEEYFSDKFPSLSNSHWFPWLQKQLLINGVLTQTPEMPDAYKPNYDRWKKEFERFSVNEDSVLVGHSCGAGFLIRWLSENKNLAYKLVLVAPWLDPGRKKTTDFFEFSIDSQITERIRELHLFISGDDEEDIQESADSIKNKFTDIQIHKFSDRGHFTFDDMGTEKFPELLKIILK